MTASPWQLATTIMEASHVHVRMDLQEMEEQMEVDVLVNSKIRSNNLLSLLLV